jgi:hypothetical protein
MKKISVALLVVILVASFAQAAPVLVPVIPGTAGNTMTVAGNVDWITTGSTETATTWRNRSLASVGGDNWCGVPGILPYSPYSATTASTAPALFTTLIVQPYEEVDVWVLFSSSWRINLVGGVNTEVLNKNCWMDAAIDDGSMATALTPHSFQAGNAVRTGLISRDERNVTTGLGIFYEVVAGYLGKATADDNGNIFLLADSRLSVPTGMTGVSAGDRSILHGYALYEIPEPATMALLGLGGLAFLRKRK